MINELTRKNAHTELDHIFKTILPAHGMTERPEQIRLSHTMLDAMFENRIALSDAGTGIGKTYAYLTAAIVYSHSRLVDGLPFQPVIIATSSIALQNAIVREYLPFLSDALSDDPHITTPILAALRKGKSHYVCDERLRQHLQQRPNGKNVMQKKELYSLRDVLDLDETQKLSSFDRERVCVPQFCDCKHPDCRYRRHLTECGQKRYLFQICNQNLWLADCMHRESGLKPILPDACTVIVDEAHKLPETAREMFGTTLVAREIRSAVVRLKQDGYALAADRLFSASSMLLQKMAELSPEYPFELLHDDLSRVLSTLFLIGRKLSTFLEPATKRALEQLTDKLCREHGLSVIMEGKPSKAVSYIEWLRQSKGQPTFRSMLEADLRDAIADANDLGHFFLLMEHKGYEIHHGNRLGFRLRGQERYMYPERKNAAFSEENIERTIAGNLAEIEAGIRPAFVPRPKPQPYRPHPKYKGFLALYYPFVRSRSSASSFAFSSAML